MGSTNASTATGGAVVRSGLLSMVALAALGSMRLVHGSLVSRSTDHETYAVVGTLIGVAMAAGLFLPAGLASAASKFISYQRARTSADGAQAVYRGLQRVGYAWALLTGIGGAIVSAALLDLAPGEAVFAGLLVAAFAVYSVEKAALYGFDRVAAYMRLEVVGSGLAVASTVLIVAMGWHAYLVPLILAYLVLAAGATVILHRRIEGPRDVLPVREITGYVTLASIGGLTSFGYLQALPIVAARFTTRAEVAQFVAAVTLVGPLYFLPRALGMALFPALAHAHGAGELDRVRRHTDLSTRVLLVLLAPTFAGTILVAREILVLFGGDTYASGVVVLQLLLMAVYVSVTQVPAVNALSSGTSRDVRVPVMSAVAGCGTGLVSAVPLGHWFGGTGVSAAYLLAVVAMQGPLVTVWRRYRMPWAGRVARSAAIVVGAFAVGRVVEAIVPPDGPRVLLDLSAALVVVALSVAILRNDIRSVISQARRRPPDGDGVEYQTADDANVAK